MDFYKSGRVFAGLGGEPQHHLVTRIADLLCGPMSSWKYDLIPILLKFACYCFVGAGGGLAPGTPKDAGICKARDSQSIEL